MRTLQYMTAAEPLTVQEAAAELRISPSAVYELIRAGRIEVQRHSVHENRRGRQLYRITREALDAYKAASTIPARSAP